MTYKSWSFLQLEPSKQKRETRTFRLARSGKLALLVHPGFRRRSRAAEWHKPFQKQIIVRDVEYQILEKVTTSKSLDRAFGTYPPTTTSKADSIETCTYLCDYDGLLVLYCCCCCCCFCRRVVVDHHSAGPSRGNFIDKILSMDGFSSLPSSRCRRRRRRVFVLRDTRAFLVQFPIRNLSGTYLRPWRPLLGRCSTPRIPRSSLSSFRTCVQ